MALGAGIEFILSEPQRGDRPLLRRTAQRVLSPRWGDTDGRPTDPGLAPWATSFRPYRGFSNAL